MSKKVFRTFGTIATIIGGIAAIGTGIGAALGGTMMLTAFGTSIAASTIAAIAGVVGMGAAMLGRPSAIKAPGATRDRLFASLDPQAPRKIVYGRTAMATDVRYQAYTGIDQEYYHQIMCVASHEVEAIEEIWFDTELAWTAASGAQGRYAGYLTVTPRLVGTASNGISIDGVWTSACTLTGCAYVHLRFKLTGNDKKAESPFAQQVPSRVTVRGKGAKLYEARLDSTAGGTGSQRVNDQSTWAYAPSGVESGRNPALQLLHYLIGWKINGKLAIGRGMPAARFDMASFITAANMCDEAVAKAAGGTEPRYRADGVFSEADDPSTVIDNLLASMNAVLRDDGGKISLTVLHNDLGAPIAHFDENDILGDELWKQTPSIDETFNIVRGSYTDASDTALYQMVDAPQVAAASIDGIDRIETFDLAVCQSPSQWQRLAKQRIQRALYAGVYSANFGARAWQVSLGKVVTLSHVGLGWDHKVFRVIAHGVAVNGVVPMALGEEHSDIYAWDKEETPAVQAAVPTVYDPTKAAVIQAIAEHDGALGSLASDIASLDAAVDGKVTTFFQVGIPVAEGIGDLWFKSDTRKWYRAQASGADEIKAGEWVLAEDAGIGVAIAAAAGAQATADGKVTTYNQQAQPTSPAIGDLWVQPSAVPKVLKRWNGTAWVAVVPASLSELDAAAKADLDAAKASIAAISSDAVLSTTEKPALITRYNESISQWTALDAKAGELAPTFDTQRNTASAAKIALVNYLAGLTPAWNNTSSNTTIVAATFQTRWSDFYNALFALDAAITGRQGAAGNDGAMAWTPVLDAAVSRTGSTFRKATGGSAWVGAYSSEKAPQASVSAKATQANANFLVGLNGSPGSGAVDVTIEHAAWLTTTGTINYWKSGGTAQAGIGTYAVGDVIGVAHRDNRIVVLKNGAVIHTDPVAVSSSKAFALHIGIFSNGTSLDNVTMARSGEGGLWTDTLYMRSAARPATPTGTSPAGWGNEIPEGSNPLWATTVTRRLDRSVVGVYSDPGLVGGQLQPDPYAAGTTYYRYQTVTHEGGTYMLTVESSVGNAPSGTAQANAWWTVIAAPGEKGAPATPPSAFTATITVPAGPTQNLRSLADAAGYTGQSNCTITFNVASGSVVRGLPGQPGIDTGTWSTDFTSTLTLNVVGTVDGGGGTGGAGTSRATGNNGSAGGDAIYVRHPITISNTGIIRGGGGGGGGGTGVFDPDGGGARGGGGGGGFPNGPGGVGYANGQPGTVAGGGAGGAGQSGGGTAGANGGGAGTSGYAIRRNGKAVTYSGGGTITGLNA